jgi:NADH-quinone oxidoreductase subunit J
MQTPETLKLVYFYSCALFAVVGALATILAANPIRGAMGLLLTICAIAALFLSLHAEFLAVVQLIVYAGAVVVLFLFAIMLLGPAAIPPKDHDTAVTRIFAAVGAVIFGAFGIGTIVVWNHAKKLPFPPLEGGEGTIEAMAHDVFGAGLVPFELSSALLIVAIVGAVAVARGRQGEAARTLPHVPPKKAQPAHHGAAE